MARVKNAAAAVFFMVLPPLVPFRGVSFTEEEAGRKSIGIRYFGLAPSALSNVRKV
jgi:hypothetical protein